MYAAHPFSVVGWDGYNFPYKFSIHDFEPITGRVHLPPPIHQTFEMAGAVICSFVPRLYDYHPQAIPAPYNHSNIDSDEVLYYVDGDFMSRNNIERGQITLHPAGIPHGPHPGAMERSIGQKETQELAVMVDTFKPLMVTEEAMKIKDGDYFQSWLESYPGAMERSIGQKETQELAVMVDTFKPLMVTEEAMKIKDGDYFQSWLES
jgi:homogentisate 1,2-dioxygenase